MSIYNVLFLLLMVSLHTQTSDAEYYCLSCTGAALPRDCNYVQICQAHSQCYVDAYVDSIGDIRFNLGCRDSMRCTAAPSAVGRRSVKGSDEATSGILESNASHTSHIRQKTKTERKVFTIREPEEVPEDAPQGHNIGNTVTYCQQCCRGHLCNANGCGNDGYPKDGGPICFGCDQMRNPARCNKLVGCGRDEVCELTYTQFLGDTVFKTACAVRVECDHRRVLDIGAFTLPSDRAMAARQGTSTQPVCRKCCSDSLCNIDDCSSAIPLTTTTTMSPTTTHMQVAGGWSHWSHWSTCGATCGGGHHQRVRLCNNPPPAYGGKACEGLPIEIGMCSTQKCLNPVDGQWSLWSSWSACSVTCGSGIISRNRTCNNPSPKDGGADCFGHATGALSCAHRPCIVAVDGLWSTWGSWSKCSVSCGSGTHSRYRTCDNPAPKNGGATCFGHESGTQSCDEGPCPVDGQWSAWDSWSPCSESCGTGTSVRNRTCNNPTPKYGGENCSGLASDTEACVNKPCPVDGQWSAWNSWGLCSASCGAGTRLRKRTCNNPAPKYGGTNCSGLATDIETCTTKSCPVDGQWSGWDSWSQCSVSCGDGSRLRNRTCDNPSPQNGGASCSGTASASEICINRPCPVDGQWSNWGSWSQCSALFCGLGNQTRSRICNDPAPIHGGTPCSGSATDTESCNAGTCGVECYYCPLPMREAALCNETRFCGIKQSCAISEMLATDGHHEYIMSCTDKEVCNGVPFGFSNDTNAGNVRERDIELQSHVRQRDVVFECCETDRCNNKSPSLLGTTPVPGHHGGGLVGPHTGHSHLCNDVDKQKCEESGTVKPEFCSDPSLTVLSDSCKRYCGKCPLECYDCSSPVRDPALCNTGRQCGVNQTCTLSEHLTSAGHHEYIMACADKKVCDEFPTGFGKEHQHFGRRNLDLGNWVNGPGVYVRCCDSDYCNKEELLLTTTTPIMTTHTLRGCGKDIAIALDASRSIGHHTFRQILHFLSQIISNIEIGPQANQVALDTFSTVSQVQWFLDTHVTREQVLQALSGIRYNTQGGTHTEKALSNIANIIFTPQHGDRANAKNVVLVVTDGHSEDFHSTFHEAKKLHQESSNVIVVGVGDHINHNELKGIATDRNHTLDITDFGNISGVVDRVLGLICT